MPPITTIVHFSLPAANMERFLASWRGYQAAVLKQPGLIDGVFHRGIDPDGPFQFINVARWQSAEALQAGLQVAGEALRRDGVDVAGALAEMGVKVSQHNYVEEVRYSRED